MRPKHLLIMIALLFSGCMTEPSEETFQESLSIRRGITSPVINEIHFDPLQDADDGIPDQPDFVEIYNPGSSAVDLTGWSITDRPGQTGKVNRYAFAPSGTGNILGPGQYAVIAPEYSAGIADSRLVQYYRHLAALPDAKIFLVKKYKTFSLNNDGDRVRLLDKTGTVVDSVDYTPDWHNPYLKSTKGISLEKFHPLMESNSYLSWSSCTDSQLGATPGTVNSVYVNQERSGSVLGAAPDPFSPDGDGRDDNLTLNISLPAESYQITLIIYDIKGRPIRALANGSPAGPSLSLMWNGLDDEGDPAPSGNYRIVFHATGVSGKKYDAEQTVVLAR